MSDAPEVDVPEEELTEHDGTRPTEEVGADQAEPGPTRCEGKASGGDRPQDAFFTQGDELHESFPVEPLHAFIAEDGLPTFDMGAPEQSEAIAFTYDTVVCVEDDREYVEVFSEELVGRGWTRRLSRGICQYYPPGVFDGFDAPDESHVFDALHERHRPQEAPPSAGALKLTARSRYDEHGVDVRRAAFAPEEVEHLWGTHLAKGDDGRWIPLRMKRERCEHYRRQVFSNDEVQDPDAFGHKIVFRNCAARRSNGGAYLSLRDEGVYACDYRSPRDEASLAEQDKKDGAKLRDQPHLRRLPLFGLPGEEMQLDAPKGASS